MTVKENKIVTWYCEKCPVHNGKDSDAWDENSPMFKNVQLVHKGHQGWKKGKPKESLKDGVKLKTEPISDEKALRALIQIFQVDNNLEFDGDDKIDHVAKTLKHFWKFVTLRKT